MRFGVFLAPFHRIPEHPTPALERSYRDAIEAALRAYEERSSGQRS
jgi:hypothetical protein